MRFVILLFVFLLLPSSTFAQNIVNFFRLMAKDHFQFLPEDTIDSFIRQGKYYPPDNDLGIEVMAYSLSVDTSRNYLRVEMSYETGQRAFSIYELRAWKTKSQDFIIVCSEHGGLPIAF